MQTAATSPESKHPKQAITGVVPPEISEAMIRQAWPSVMTMPGLARLCEKMMRTIVLAPLAWAMLALPYFKKVLPITAKRYLVTNRRVMIVSGWKATPTHEIPLGQIDDVRLDESSYSHFYRSGTLEVISKGQVALRLPGVPEPESFRRAILNASMAWAPKHQVTTG